MRVLIATDAWEPQINGVVRTLQQVRALGPSLGMEISLVSPADFLNVAMPGYPEIRLGLATKGALLRKIAAFRPDIIHVATEGPIGLAARKASLVANLPLSTSYHTRFPEYLRARLPVPLAASYAVLRHFHQAADGILVSTPSLETDLEARGFTNLLRWSRGVDLSIYSPRPDRERRKEPVFLNVGRVAVEKNLEAFLALKLPGRKVLVGDGPQLASLRRKYPEVEMPGALTGAALAEAYRQADVFVFPSRTDTFGVVLLEALASGLPVAAYPVMGPRDVIGMEGPGILSEDLCAAALACLDIPAEQCTAHAARFTWQASIAQFRTCLDLAILRHRQKIGDEKRSIAV